MCICRFTMTYIHVHNSAYNKSCMELHLCCICTTALNQKLCYRFEFCGFCCRVFCWHHLELTWCMYTDWCNVPYQNVAHTHTTSRHAHISTCGREFLCDSVTNWKVVRAGYIRSIVFFRVQVHWCIHCTIGHVLALYQHANTYQYLYMHEQNCVNLDGLGHFPEVLDTPSFMRSESKLHLKNGNLVWWLKVWLDHNILENMVQRWIPWHSTVFHIHIWGMMNSLYTVCVQHLWCL